MTSNNNTITKEYLQYLFTYDRVTGLLTWNERSPKSIKDERYCNMFNKKYKHKIAGTRMTNNAGKTYLRVRIDYKHLFIHRIIWKLIHGEFPEYIDHINGDGTDNRLCNLRSVTSKENHKNARLSKANKTGYTGIYIAPSQRYQAIIICEGERHYLGSFDEYFDAVCARKSAEIKYGFHPNHGSIRPL